MNSYQLTRRTWLAGAATTLSANALGQPTARARKGRRADAAAPTRVELWGGKTVGPKTTHQRGRVVWSAGAIESVEAATGSTPPAGAIDVRGHVVTYGLCDPITTVGLVEVSLEPSSREDAATIDDPVRAAYRAADGYNPDSSLIAVARLGGLTSVGAVPTGGFVAGQSAWCDLHGATAKAAVATSGGALHITMQQGGWDAKTRGTALSLLRMRELLDDAAAYRKNRAAFERRQLRELNVSTRDLATMVRVLNGKLPVVFHVDAAPDILRVAELIASYKLSGIIASGAEAWKVRKQLAKQKLPVILDPLDNGPRSFTARGAREDNAKLLHAAGVTIAFSTWESHNVRRLRQSAGNAVRAGLPHRAALAAITETAPAMLGAAGYVGLDKGSVANVAVWSGDPLELSTRLERLFIHGKPIALRSRQTTLFERYR